MNVCVCVFVFQFQQLKSEKWNSVIKPVDDFKASNH
jgi:hypothetical protein